MNNESNSIFEILKFTDDNELEVCLFQKKDNLNRRYYRGDYENADTWAMTTNDTIQYLSDASNNLMVEIKLDISQADIQKDVFNIEDSVIGRLLELESIKDNMYNIIQVIQKVGDKYNLKNYKIIKNMGKFMLNLDSSGILKQSVYDDNYLFNDSEYGHVAFITKVNPMLLLFDGASHTLSIPDYKKISFSYGTDTSDIYTNMDNFGAFYLASSIKTIITLFKNKGIMHYKENVFERISFKNRSDFGRMPKTLFKLDEIISTDLDNNKSNFNIINFPHINGLTKRNFISPLDTYVYNVAGFVENNVFKTICGFEVFDTKFSKEEISEKLDTVKDSKFTYTEAIFFIPEEFEMKKIKENHDELYQIQLDNLKKRWDKTIATYQRIFNRGQIDEGFLALLFIKKYFVYKTNNSHRLNQVAKSSLTAVTDFFSINYIPYADFFGEDTTTNFLTSITKLDAQVYRWVNSRIENANLTLQAVTKQGHHYTHIQMNLFPNQDTFYIGINTFHHRLESRQTSLIVVNDSGNKQAWKKKTRLMINKIISNSKGRLNIIILDPKDKIELMMIKRISNGNSAIIYYSEFEKDIDIPKPAVKLATDKITYYNGSSFDQRVRKITSVKNSITSLDPTTTMFMEFVASTRKFTFDGKEYRETEFNYLRWNRLMREFSGREIILANKNTLAKIKETYPEEFMTMNTYLNSDLVEEDFKNIHNTYLFIDCGKTLDTIFDMVSFGSNEIFNSLYSNIKESSKQNINIIKFWYLILNSMEEDTSYVFGLMTNIMEQSPKSLNGNRWVDSSRIIKKNIIMKPTVTENTINKKIYNKLPINDNYGLIESAAIKHKRQYDIGLLGGFNKSLFDFDIFTDKVTELLNDSNKLNLTLDETFAHMDILLGYYMDRWDYKLDSIKELI